MKISIALISLLFSLSSIACVEKVQQQIEEKYNTDYFIEISSPAEKKLKDLRLMNDFFYVADKSALENPETDVYAADSSAPGCYGFEYVLFDKTECRLLAIGGGYCD